MQDETGMTEDEIRLANEEQKALCLDMMAVLGRHYPDLMTQETVQTRSLGIAMAGVTDLLGGMLALAASLYPDDPDGSFLSTIDRLMKVRDMYIKDEAPAGYSVTEI